MWGLITIFMEFVGQAYVRHAGGSVGRSTIINTRQRMYYTMLSPKFSYNLKYNFIVLPCLGTILVYIIIIQLLAVLSTILPQSWPDPPYLHYTLSKLSHGFAPPWMLTILRLLLRVKPSFDDDGCRWWSRCTARDPPECQQWQSEGCAKICTHIPTFFLMVMRFLSFVFKIFMHLHIYLHTNFLPAFHSDESSLVFISTKFSLRPVH